MTTMTKHVQTTIRYDGPALVEHEMDVQDLAPALLALAEIAKIANQKFNGDRASIKIMVNADTEQKCFQLDLSLVQSWMDQASLFLGKDNVKTAGQLATIIGLAGPPATGLFWLFKKLYGADKAEGDNSEISFTASDSTGLTIINIVGSDNHLTVQNETAVLAQDPKVLQHVKTVLDPLKLPGYRDFSIRQGDEPLVQINSQEAANIRSAAAPLALPEPEVFDDEERTPINGRVMVKTQRNEGKAQWELKWAGRAEWASIDDLAWLQRFQTGQIPHSIPLYLDVQMVMITSRNNPDAPARFHVVKVLDAISGSGGSQDTLF